MKYIVEIVPPHKSIQEVLNAGKPGYEFKQYVVVPQKDYGPYREVTWVKTN